MTNLYRMALRSGFFVLLPGLCNASNNPWTKADQIEREPKPGDLLAYPAEGQTVRVNPPGFS